MTTLKVTDQFNAAADAVLYEGDTLALLRSVPNGIARLVVTSPPYNLGKAYETRAPLDEYLRLQRQVIEECVRVLAKDGSICWQVGNYVELVERLVLSMTNEVDYVLDPFAGVGSAHIAALMHGRKAIGAEIVHEYV